MNYVLIIHEVADYNSWKLVFDGAATIRKEAGEQSWQLFRFENEPKRVVHLSCWDSNVNAKIFFESPTLVRIREKAGVKYPTFLYLDKLEEGIL